MAMDILDATTAAAVAAAAFQDDQIDALKAAWAGGNVTVLTYAGATLLDTGTYGPWTRDAVPSPQEMRLGARSSRTFSASGTPNKVVFRSGSTDIFSMSASVSPNTSGDIVFAGAITSASATNLSAIVITALATLPGSDWPTWRNAMTPNTWAQIGTATMDAIDPEDSAALNPNGAGVASPWRGSNGQAAILDAWGSACWDEATRTLWVPLGGGHNNYYGNESYSQNLGGNSPTWTLERAPTGAIGNTGSLASNGTDVHFDGQPRSPHSYGNIVFADGTGPVAVRLGFYDGSATSSQGVFFFDGTDWTKVYTFSGSGTPVIGACYDPTRNRIFSVAQRGVFGPLQWVNPDPLSSSWTGGDSSLSEIWPGAYGQLTYLPDQDRILLTTSTGAGSDILAYLVNPTTGAQTSLTLTGSPPSGFDWNNGRAGIAWSPELGKLLLWSFTTNTTAVATLTPVSGGLSEWTWGSLTLNGANTVTPSARNANGTYRKWGYSSALGGCYLLGTSTEPTLFYATE